MVAIHPLVQCSASAIATRHRIRSPRMGFNSSHSSRLYETPKLLLCGYALSSLDPLIGHLGIMDSTEWHTEQWHCCLSLICNLSFPTSALHYARVTDQVLCSKYYQAESSDDTSQTDGAFKW